jgi:membrane protein YqaA with SNARE-associated domain
VAIISGYMGLPYAYFALPTFLGRFLRFLALGSGAVAIWGKAFL